MSDTIQDERDGGRTDFDVLLVEDNPGDARLIEEMLRDAEEIFSRVDLDAASAPRVNHERRLSAGLEHLAAHDVDVILLDLNLPDSAGLDTLRRVSDAADLTPIIVLTGLDDHEIGLRAIQHGAQDYLVKDDVTGNMLARSIHYAVERARQRRQLKTLNQLNRIAQDVTHHVIATSTREELEAAVCERLAESDAYRFAWIGSVEPGSDRVVPQAAAGIEEDYLDEITITVDDGETGQGPTARAIDTEELQVMQDILGDPEYDPWREQARERGYRSSAAIPIVYENLLYGVLNVYASTPNAFSEREVELLGRLGDVIGHAIAAVERKDALQSDTVLELEFQVEGIAGELTSLTAGGDGRIRIDHLTRGDDVYLAYGDVTGIDRERLGEAVERSEAIDDLRTLRADSEGYAVEFAVGIGRSLFEGIAAHGGHVHAIRIADGEVRLVVHFPPDRDGRQLVELVEERCPNATFFARQRVQRQDGDLSDPHAMLETLTERQRTALETAYFAGYFDWPRETNGGEIADRLGISPPTFSEHLRTAEQKVFDAMFASDPDGPGDRLE